MTKKTPGTSTGARDSRWVWDVEPAPGDLELVHAFANSAGPGGTGDELASPRAVTAWLERWGLPGTATELADDDVERARSVRAGLAALIAGNSGRAVDAEAVANLDRVAAETPCVLRFEVGFAARWEPRDGGLGAALGRLLTIVAAAQDAGRWRRLKVCGAPGCSTVYYDFSSTCSRRWCAARCGNRLSARRTRRRYSRSSY